MVPNLKHSGLNLVPKLFVRAASMALWNKLQNLTPDNLFTIITGSPGVGKSTELFGWLSYKGATEPTVWMHFRFSSVYYVVFQPDKAPVYGKREGIDTLKVMDVLLSRYGAKIVALDGFSHASKIFADSVGHFYDSKAGIRLIYCCSFQVLNCLNSEHLVSLHNKGLVELKVPSWILDDYIAAFKGKAFAFNGCAIRSLADVHEHYYYAGGSIRLFVINLKLCINSMNVFISKISDASVLISGLSGQSSETAVNSLFQTFPGKDNMLKSSLVSQYASRRLSSMMSASFIETAKSYLPNNPSFQGWILEMEVLGKIKAKQVNLSNGSDLWNEWVSVVNFEDAISIQGRSIGDMTLLVPTKYNHGLFDIMLYVRKGHIIIANVTRAKQHEFNMELVIPYIKIFKSDKSCKVDMDIVIPADSSNTYNLTKNHFKMRHCLWAYDDRWKTSLSECCKVRLYSANDPTADRNSVDFKAMLVSEPHSMKLRKRTLAQV